MHFSQYSEKWVGVIKLDDFFGLTNNPSVILERMTPTLAQGRLGLWFYQNVIRIYHLPFLNIFTGWMTHPLRSKLSLLNGRSKPLLYGNHQNSQARFGEPLPYRLPLTFFRPTSSLFTAGASPCSTGTPKTHSSFRGTPTYLRQEQAPALHFTSFVRGMHFNVLPKKSA